MTYALISENNWHSSTYEWLEELGGQWHVAEEPPDGVGVLSGGEYRALVLGRGHHHLLRDPIGDFLVLDDWLQRWVLHKRGLLHLAGRPVG